MTVTTIPSTPSTRSIPSMRKSDQAQSLGTCVLRSDGTVVGYVRRSAATAIATTTRGGAPATPHTGVWNLGGCPAPVRRPSVPPQAA